METSMKNISGIVPVILAAVVGIGAVVSLSDFIMKPFKQVLLAGMREKTVMSLLLSIIWVSC